MKRRDAVLVPLALGVAMLAGAQVPGRTYRIGFLGFTASRTPAEMRDWTVFVEHLRDLGYRRGGNLVIELLKLLQRTGTIGKDLGPMSRRQ